MPTDRALTDQAIDWLLALPSALRPQISRQFRRIVNALAEAGTSGTIATPPWQALVGRPWRAGRVSTGGAPGAGHAARLDAGLLASATSHRRGGATVCFCQSQRDTQARSRAGLLNAAAHADIDLSGTVHGPGLREWRWHDQDAGGSEGKSADLGHGRHDARRRDLAQSKAVLVGRVEIAAGIEVMHMIRKGQLGGVKDPASSAANQLYSLAF